MSFDAHAIASLLCSHGLIRVSMGCLHGLKRQAHESMLPLTKITKENETRLREALQDKSIVNPFILLMLRQNDYPVQMHRSGWNILHEGALCERALPGGLSSHLLTELDGHQSGIHHVAGDSESLAHELLATHNAAFVLAALRSSLRPARDVLKAGAQACLAGSTHDKEECLRLLHVERN